MPGLHCPVLVREVIQYLITTPEGIYVDATVGGGGHSEAIARVLGSRGQIIGIDQDQEALKLAGPRLNSFGDKIRLMQANFSQLDKVLEKMGTGPVQGVLVDLGMSSMQLDQWGRGFSFNRDEPLDMRMDASGKITARELVNKLTARELSDIFKKYGEEKKAGLIAKVIVRERQKEPITSALQLAKLVQAVSPRFKRGEAKHPATRVFQALRIAVNGELEHLQDFLKKIPDVIVKGGRLVVLSYHSLEDRMVKQAMLTWEQGCECPPDLPYCGCGKSPLFRRLLKKGLRPGMQEIQDNPRARSAILRAAERI
jgi:16S rRNA (cytosine1402-N4)-methyltransferase